jgi:hypothetical protein
MLPGQYLVLSPSGETVIAQYQTGKREAMIDLQQFPSYNNDEGICLLANGSGEIIDALEYTDEMHFPLLQHLDGVSLERVSWYVSARETENWHSASEASGYGTPGYQNSQYLSLPDSIEAQLSIQPEIFSPDNDGYHDVQGVNYQFNQPGYLLTINIYNADGSFIKNLVNNEYAGTEGVILWNGLGEHNTPVPFGIYVYAIQVVDVSGSVFLFKKTGVLAKKL